MSDYSSSEGSDDEYGPIATSWGDQASTEPETPAGDWSSLENPNAKLGPSGLGSGDLHRKGRNYKPVDETMILRQRLKKASLKSEEEKAAARQQRRSSSRPRGRFSRPVSSTSTRSRPLSTTSRRSHKPLRRSSSTPTSTPTSTTTTTTTVYDYPRKPSLSEHRQTAPWEESPKPKKPSVRFSQPLECPTPPTLHSPKMAEKPLVNNNNPWANKPLMEEPFWAEPVKKPEDPTVNAKPPTDNKPHTVIEEKLVEEMEPQPSSHLELSTSTWSSGGVLTPSPVATPTKRADSAPWDSPQTDNWLDTFTPVETITPPATISPPGTKPSSPEIQPPSPASSIQQLDSTSKELPPAASPVATPTASDSSWQSSTTNDTSVDDAWGASNQKAQDSWNTPSWDSPTSTTQNNTSSWNPASDTARTSSTESWNPANDAAQANTTDSWDSPSTANDTQGWNSGPPPWGSTQANDTTPSWANDSKTQNWSGDPWGATDSTSKDNDTQGSTDSILKSNGTWGSTDSNTNNSGTWGSTSASSYNNDTWGSVDSSSNGNENGWANTPADWGSSTADNGWGSATTTAPAAEKKEPSRFSRSDRPKYSARFKGPLPANYNNKPLSPPTKVAPPSRVDNPILVTVNVGLSNDKNIPVHIHLYDDPQALARQFARDNAIQSPNIIDAVHKLFANQKAMAMKKRSRPPVNTTYSSARYNPHPHRHYSNV